MEWAYLVMTLFVFLCLYLFINDSKGYNTIIYIKTRRKWSGFPINNSEQGKK